MNGGITQAITNIFPRKTIVVGAMMKTFQFRLYPTRSQRKALLHTLEICRWVYNSTLALRKNTWEQEGRSISLYDTNRALTEWKNSNAEFHSVHSQVLQNVQVRVDLAYNAFFRRVRAGEKPGYPRFKGKGRYDSFTFPQSGFSVQDGILRLSKIGNIKIIQHRPIQGKIKTLTVRKDAVGNWCAAFACEVEPEPLPANERAVGIDVGLESFATLSTGEKISNPRFFRKSEKELAKVQRKLSNAEKGTPERTKRRLAVAKVHKTVANRRGDFAHKLSRRLVNECGVIAFEELSIRGMLKNHGLAKSISDAAWNQLVQFTTYKAEEAGRSVVLVNPNGTSQRCSKCGMVVKKDLSVRVHSCPTCGLVIDRDENAAINILALGLQCLGESPRSRLVHRAE